MPEGGYGRLDIRYNPYRAAARRDQHRRSMITPRRHELQGGALMSTLPTSPEHHATGPEPSPRHGPVVELLIALVDRGRDGPGRRRLRA